MLVEGSSIRSTARLTGVSTNTVLKLLREAGEACAAFHHDHMRGIRVRRVECDEIWCYAYARQKNVPRILGNPEWAGDVWTWTALAPDSKLMVSWLVGDRTQSSANEFMLDLRARLEGRVQITTDGYQAYVPAIESAFGADADFARIIKVFVPHPEEDSRVMSVSEIVSGSPDERFISTSLVERMNRSMRMGVRRYTRKTDAFSKKIENHRHALALYFTWYNFVRRHMSLGTTPAVSAGLDERPRSMEWILEMVEERRPARAAYRRRSQLLKANTLRT